MKKIFLVIILFIIYGPLCHCQMANDTFLLGPKYGISGFYDNNMHAVDLRQLSNIPDSVPRSANGSMQGFTIGAFYEYRITDRTSFMLRGLFSSNKAEISGLTPETLKINGFDTLGLSNHKLKTDLTNVRIEPLIKYRLFNRFSLFGGFNAGLRFDKSFSHTEIVNNPENALFSNGSKIRLGVDEDKKDNLGLQAALVLGFSYDIPINYNGKYLIMPEIMFETGFSDITSEITWDVNTLKAGITLMYSKNPTVMPDIIEIFQKKDEVKILNVKVAQLEKEYLKPGLTVFQYDTLIRDYEIRITQTAIRIDTLFYPENVKYVDVVKTERASIKDYVKRSCFKLYSMGSDGKYEYPQSNLKVEEFLSTSIQPLLNYIFFEENSDIIPSRYNLLSNEETDFFKIEELRNLSTIRTYYHILNIIGKRMQLTSESNITISGCNSGIDEEKDNIELSRKRAETVKNYLVNTWKIDSTRIKVIALNLSEKASNLTDPDGIEENRRVEISSSSLELLAPVIINDTLRDVSPPQIRFYNNANSCFKIGKWVLNAYQSGKPLIGFRGEYNMPEKITWRLSEAKQTVPTTSDPVIFNVEITDYDGNKFTSPDDTILVDQLTIREKMIHDEIDKKIDKYSLILFEFDKALLNQSNENILKFINDKIEKNSIVTIYGYTDRMGNDEYNLQLSQKRAANVASQIEHSKDIHYEGLGEQDLIYNNELPEGRFYCRTVKITVETPLE